MYKSKNELAPEILNYMSLIDLSLKIDFRERERERERERVT
jgi:hypothetical protein